MARRRLLEGTLTVMGLLVALDVGVDLALIRGDTVMGRTLPPAGYRRWPGKDSWLAEYRASWNLPREQRSKFQFDAELGWTARPLFRTVDGGTRINSIGARGPGEYASEPPDGALRVVAFGDSFTFCAQVEDAGSWPVQLEELEPSLEVINFGVSGFGTDQALLRMRRTGILGADVVCMGLMLENVGRNVTRDGMSWRILDRKPTPKPRFVLDGEELELVPLPFSSASDFAHAVEDDRIEGLLKEHEHWAPPALPDFLWRSSFVRIAVALSQKGRRNVPRLWTETETEPYRTTVALLEAFRDEALEAGARRAVVLVFPLERDLTGLRRGEPRYWTFLLEELERRGIEFIDLTLPLEEAYRTTRPGSSLFRGWHLSELGNAVVARAMHEWLSDEELR